MTSELKKEERSQPKEDIEEVRVLIKTHREYFTPCTNSRIIIHLILACYFSEFNCIFLCLIILHLWMRTASPLSREVDKLRSERLKGLNPQPYSPPGASPASPSNTPARPKPSFFKNTIRVILSDVDPKFNFKVKLMSELKLFHHNIKVSKVLERKNNRFLIIGDTPQDVGILQSESKMKACLGQTVKISLPKAYQIAKPEKSLVVKGTPAEVTKQKFKEFLDLNKINYAKAERLTSKKDGRVLEMFKLEIKGDTETKTLTTENLTCPITGIIYRVEEFRTPFWYSSAGTSKVSHIPHPLRIPLKPKDLLS